MPEGYGFLVPPTRRGAIMAEDRTNAPSAEELKKRIEELGEKSNLGAGAEEPDPATAENPPSEPKAGDEQRSQT
jgi:hypothetical protein